jgi:hypothetical protein
LAVVGSNTTIIIYGAAVADGTRSDGAGAELTVREVRNKEGLGEGGGGQEQEDEGIKEHLNFLKAEDVKGILW